MVKNPQKSIIQEDQQLVKVQNNSELEITRFQNVGTWPSNNCPRVNLLRFYALIIWIREAAEIISNKVEHHGSRKDLILPTNLKFMIAQHNLNSQETNQLFQKDASL